MMKNYVSRALKACKNFTESDMFSWAVKGTGAAIAGGGTAYLLNRYGVYAPALPIAIGSATWSVGEAIEAFRIYRDQDMKYTGSKINLLGAGLRVFGSACLATISSLTHNMPDYDSLLLVDPIVDASKIVASGYVLEYGLGRRMKARESPRCATADKLEKLAKKLRNDKTPFQGDDFKEMRELYLEELSLD